MDKELKVYDYQLKKYVSYYILNSKDVNSINKYMNTLLKINDKIIDPNVENPKELKKKLIFNKTPLNVIITSINNTRFVSTSLSTRGWSKESNIIISYFHNNNISDEDKIKIYNKIQSNKEITKNKYIPFFKDLNNYKVINENKDFNRSELMYFMMDIESTINNKNEQSIIEVESILNMIIKNIENIIEVQNSSDIQNISDRLNKLLKSNFFSQNNLKKDTINKIFNLALNIKKKTKIRLGYGKIVEGLYTHHKLDKLTKLNYDFNPLNCLNKNMENPKYNKKIFNKLEYNEENGIGNLDISGIVVEEMKKSSIPIKKETSFEISSDFQKKYLEENILNIIKNNINELRTNKYLINFIENPPRLKNGKETYQKELIKYKWLYNDYEINNDEDSFSFVKDLILRTTIFLSNSEVNESKSRNLLLTNNSHVLMMVINNVSLMEKLYNEDIDLYIELFETMEDIFMSDFKKFSSIYSDNPIFNLEYLNFETFKNSEEDFKVKYMNNLLKIFDRRRSTINEEDELSKLIVDNIDIANKSLEDFESTTEIGERINYIINKLYEIESTYLINFNEKLDNKNNKGINENLSYLF